MNYSKCSTHQDRKQQVICLSDDCQQRFVARCVQCVMTSKCRQSHHWKMITQTIEEIHQVCEIAQIKSQKNQSNPNKKSSPTNDAHIKHIQLVVEEMKERANQIKEAVLAAIMKRAEKLLGKTNSVQSFSKVKQILKGCKKDSESKKLNSGLKNVGSLLKCSDGSLELLEASAEELGDIDISIFENQSNKILDNLSYIIMDDGEMPSQQKEVEKNYQKQIDKLLEQLKELPVLQNRILALSEKLQIKDAKLKKYEGMGESGIKQSPQSLLKKKSSIDDIEQIRNKNTTRIQSLIQRRKELFNAFQQYIKKNPKEELYIYNLKPGVNAIKLEIPTSSNVTYLFNENSLSICDELQFLGYSDSISGEQTVEIPLISFKKEQPKPKREVDINPFLELLMGLK